MLNRKHSGLLLLLFCNIIVIHDAWAQILFPPAFGTQTDRNNYRSEMVLVYEQDFESDDLSDVDFLSQDVQVTQNVNIVIDGARSALFDGPMTAIYMDAEHTGMLPDAVYEVMFDYSVLNLPTGQTYAVGVGFEWPGFALGEPFNLTGPADVSTEPAGRFRRQIRTGMDSNIAIAFINFGATVVLDNIKIYRCESRLHRAVAPVHKIGFPRLGNYNLYSASATALRNGNVSSAEVESTLGMFDLVTGYEIDHTILPTDAGRKLREINPLIRILPYHQTFVLQDDGSQPVAGSAGILQLFNRGIDESFFMRKPDGTLLEEPRFPNHFQMNHTSFAPRVDGYSFTDYTVEYFAKTIFPSGLWDGVHFDQSEWYPNPLLANTHPFLETPGPLPPMDLNNDGTAEDLSVIEAEWYNAYIAYFDTLHQRFGYTKLLFGNAGEIATRPSVLKRLNGFQREFLLPYEIDQNGDFDLRSSTSWHDLMRRYSIAMQHLREPQVINFQFTGYKLGSANGEITNNGLEDRLPILEPRDFQRMRLGLSTVLMGDGFFGYDYVDNTTLPVWFDEYAVGSNGVAIKDVAAKGYLGQPLGDAIEVLHSANEVLFDVDFEVASQFPPGTGVANYALSEDQNEVLEGVRSVVFSATGLEEGESMLTLFSNLGQFDLEADTNYQLLLDYRILSGAQSAGNNGFFSLGIFDPQMTSSELASSTAAIWDPESGQAGTLRASVKTRSGDAQLLAYMHSNGSIVVDNIRLIKGPGGVFRRDFENGIALVNPTNSYTTLTQAEVDGALNRTGVRRISGVQDPIINSGVSVVAGLTLPPADGIILLADPIVAPSSVTPGSILATSNATSMTLSWLPSGGVVAGYIIEYGIDGGELTEFALANKNSPSLTLKNIDPGTTYGVRVASYNYLGVFSVFSPVSTITTSGTQSQRPEIYNLPGLSPGAVIEINGTNLSASGDLLPLPPFPTELVGTQILVNDIPSPIAALRSDRITVVVPAELAGETATVEVIRNGVRSPTKIASIENSVSSVWVDFSNTGIEYGTKSYPFNTLSEAIEVVGSGGSITIFGDASITWTDEKPTISKPMRLGTINGTGTVGVP